jgi:transposase
MAKPKTSDTKHLALARDGALNPRALDVRDPLFRENDFFDARDLVQVKYEMLRRARVDRYPVSRAAAQFGFSRPSFYEAKAAFEQSGLAGLAPRKRGPRGGHKLTETVLASLAEAKASDPTLSATALARRLEQEAGLTVHPRTIERGLARSRKKVR